MGLSVRLVAPVICGLLGLGGGTAAALLADRGEPDSNDAVRDPLGLGIELTDLECTGESLLVIGWGSSAAALAAPLADNSGSEVRYLRSADSCNTLYGREKGPTPDYAAYLGPFDTIADACELRMTVLHRGDLVTVLRADNDQAVRCPCHLPSETFPVLRPGMTTDSATTQWVRALQQLLVDIDEERFAPWRATGVYDDATVDRVRELQDEARIPVTGIVDSAVWRSLRDRVCDTYDY